MAQKNKAHEGKSSVSILLEDDEYRRLRIVAAQNECSVAEFCRIQIRAALNKKTKREV